MIRTEEENGLNIMAKLAVSIGELGQGVKKLTRAQEARMYSTPVYYHPSDNVFITNTFGVVRLAGPDQGHMWYVRSITAGGVSPTTVAAGRADIFSTAHDARAKTSVTQMAITDWREQLTALPGILHFASGDLVLRDNEELYVFFSNATNSQQYVATAHVIDYEEAAIRQAYSL